MIKGFPPIVDKKTAVLVIGTAPSVDSLKANEYYGHARNQFWPLVFELFENGRKPKDYADKVQTAHAHRIGLFDALASCVRPGSLDSNIRGETPNDFPAFFNKYPQIGMLVFNGQSSFKFYKKAFGEPKKMYCVLPSTSPAHASKTFDQKLSLWREAFKKGGVL